MSLANDIQSNIKSEFELDETPPEMIKFCTGIALDLTSSLFPPIPLQNNLTMQFPFPPGFIQMLALSDGITVPVLDAEIKQNITPTPIIIPIEIVASTVGNNLKGIFQNGDLGYFTSLGKAVAIAYLGRTT
jgi:hypothetical protein